MLRYREIGASWGKQIKVQITKVDPVGDKGRRKTEKSQMCEKLYLILVFFIF
jgi:hypothetical protein